MILVVHYREPLRRLLVASLSEIGCPIIAKTSGEEAVELFAAHGAHFGLLVAGNVMPGMSGPALAERFRGCCGPVTPVIMTCPYERPPNGACDMFLPEPFVVGDVVRAARRLMVPG
jgi:CheY-like chemotaxis protein